MVFNGTFDARFDFNPTDKKVILSVDGGGMRGAISIAMLAELEDRTGKTCQQMFDMVAGTSTGAIIAVGLAVGLTANDILNEVYRKGLPNAFEQGGDIGDIGFFVTGLLKRFGIPDTEFIARLVRNDFRFAYPLEPFLAELKDLVGSQKVGDLNSDNPILFVTTKDTLTRESCFIVSTGPGRDKFAHWPLPAVVAASGAAPVFFPSVIDRFVDGGVGVYTNPCLGASVEAMEYIGENRGFTDGNVIHISLGTGYVDFKPTSDNIRGYNALDWLRYVIMENLNDGALQQVFTTRAIYGGKSKNQRMDFRRYNPLLSADSVENELGISLAGKPDPTLLGLDSFQSDQVELMIEIGRAYARAIDWSQPDALPWNTPGGHTDPAKLTPIDVKWNEKNILEKWVAEALEGELI